ncbi:MAG: hypothetical protein WA960_06495 [Tunicatimonas sp.]
MEELPALPERFQPRGNSSFYAVVTFVDVRIIQTKETLLDKYWSFSLEDLGLDAYLVEVYPPESDQHATITENFRRNWQNRFGKDRDGHPKGFIKLDW